MADTFSDPDFANSVSMKSVSGMVLRMYGNTCFLAFQEEIIAGDMTEAELLAMSSTANELMCAML